MHHVYLGTTFLYLGLNTYAELTFLCLVVGYNQLNNYWNIILLFSIFLLWEYTPQVTMLSFAVWSAWTYVQQ